MFRETRLILSAMLMCATNYVVAQNDLIVLRDGTEIASKVMQISVKEVSYKEKANDKQSQQIDLKDVYMVRFEKRGNIYITEDCKRITGENDKWNKDADRIYLTKGKEIQAFNLNVKENTITYTLTQKGKGKKSNMIEVETISPAEVFMIKYSDGTKDIINDIQAQKEEEAKPETQTSPVKENEKKVIFHSVKKGETLASIAQRYAVTVAEIIEWNDLSKNTKANTRLQNGTQLMVYVKPSNDK